MIEYMFIYMVTLLAAPEIDIFPFRLPIVIAKCIHARTKTHTEGNVQMDEMSFNPHTFMAAFHLSHHDILFPLPFILSFSVSSFVHSLMPIRNVTYTKYKLL